jgi:uncharacterized protein (TIGR02001 family)
MKVTITAVAMVALLAPVIADAQTADAKAAPASTLTGNFAVVSDYRFRGISQSYKLPAVQGGIDWNHSSGLYLGNWNSSVSGNSFPNGASIEMDFYGGYKFAVAEGLTLDVGALYYYYPGGFYNVPARTTFNNFEVYVGATWGSFSGKVFVTTTDLFGINSDTYGGKDSKGSYYVDLNYSTEIMPKVTLLGHVGYQSVRNYSDLSYWDYKVGLTYDWSGWMLGAALVGTNADSNLYYAVDSSGKTKSTGKATVVLSIGKSF